MQPKGRKSVKRKQVKNRFETGTVITNCASTVASLREFIIYLIATFLVPKAQKYLASF